MHYKDGTPAMLGDTVRGKGYNLEREIQGVVLHLDKRSETCNIIVGYVYFAPIFQNGQVFRHAHLVNPDALHAADYITESASCAIGEEYGETKNFELVARADGKPVEAPGS